MIKVTAKHTHPTWTLEGQLFAVMDAGDAWSDYRVGGNKEHGYYAIAPKFGCGKYGGSPMAAIESLLRDNGCTGFSFETVTTNAEFMAERALGDGPASELDTSALQYITEEDKRAVLAAIDVLLDCDHAISINDGEETVLRNSVVAQDIVNAMGSTDSDWLMVDGIGKFQFVYGMSDAEETIGDYSWKPGCEAKMDSLHAAIMAELAPQVSPDGQFTVAVTILASVTMTAATMTAAMREAREFFENAAPWMAYADGWNSARETGATIVDIGGFDVETIEGESEA